MNCGIRECTVVEKTFEYRNVFLTTTIKAFARFTLVLSMMTIMLRASSMPEFGFKNFRECAAGGLIDNLLK